MDSLTVLINDIKREADKLKSAGVDLSGLEFKKAEKHVPNRNLYNEFEIVRLQLKNSGADLSRIIISQA